MISNHIFKANVEWQLGHNETTKNVKSFSRNHKVIIPDKKSMLKISAAKQFRGDKTLYNPEDLLLSALASCHMMSYLYVCSKNNIEVLSYFDTAMAVLKVEGTGSGSFEKVTLNPVVTIRESSKKELAKALHIEANSLCFIANSCNFEILHYAKIIINKTLQ